MGTLVLQWTHPSCNCVDLKSKSLSLKQKCFSVMANILIFTILKKKKKTHTHTCEEGGTHFRICLAFVDKLKKQLFIKKLLEWVNKKGQNFNIYVAGF